MPIADLSTAEGKLMLQMFSAFAEFERNRIRERTQDGLKHAKEQGKRLGRPAAIETLKKVQECKGYGMTQSATAKQLNISIPTVKRHWNKLV